MNQKSLKEKVKIFVFYLILATDFEISLPTVQLITIIASHLSMNFNHSKCLQSHIWFKVLLFSFFQFNPASQFLLQLVLDGNLLFLDLFLHLFLQLGRCIERRGKNNNSTLVVQKLLAPLCRLLLILQLILAGFHLFLHGRYSNAGSLIRKI